MSYANGTTHYNLPQTVGTDKRDWSDTNQAFSDIDAAIYSAASDATSASSNFTTLDSQINGAGGIDSRLTTAEHDIDNCEGDISTLQSTVSGHTAAISDVRSDLQDAIVAYNEPTATSTHAYAEGDYFFYNDILYKASAAIAIGDTIVPNTNCVATNVITEVAANTTEIDSVKSALPSVVATVTADGVKTFRELLNTIYTSVSGLSDIERSQLKVVYSRSDGSSTVHTVSSMDTTSITFSETDATHVYVVVLNATTSNYARTAFGASSDDYSAVAATSGTVISLIK